MKFVLVLEDDLALRNQIYEALRVVGPQIQLRFFGSLEEFHVWLKLALQDGPKSLAGAGSVHPNDKIADIAPADNHVLSLVVSKDEFLGSRQMNLMKRTIEMFIRKGLCTKEDPTSLIITAFDNPDFDIHLVEQRFINNVIYKPFDTMILQQHLLFAINGHHKVPSTILHNMKTDATVEMLKDIEFEAWSELGFVTRSDREIPIGAVSKYYVQLAPKSERMVVYAGCYKNMKHPIHANEFRSFFRLYAPSPGILNRLRKELPKDAEALKEGIDQDLLLTNSNLNCVIIDAEEGKDLDIAKTMTRVFFNVGVLQYKSLNEFLMELDPEEFEKGVKRKKAWNNDQPLRLIYNSTGQMLMNTDPDIGDMGTVFGLKKRELLNFDFGKLLSPTDKNEWKKFVLGQQMMNTQFKFSYEGEVYFIQATDRVESVDDKGKKTIVVTIRELTVDERCARMKSDSRLSSKIDCLFIREAELGEQFRERWDPILAKIGKPFLFLLADAEIPELKVRALSHLLTDIFYRPFDLNYILKKLYCVMPSLKTKEDYSAGFKESFASGKVANPIHISEISEAGLVMNYHRPLELGVFREFIMWMPGAIDIPIVIGTCNFVEESEVEASKEEESNPSVETIAQSNSAGGADGVAGADPAAGGKKQDKVIYDNHFVFFGVRDLQLKHIRLWHRDAYILSKKEG